MSMNNVLILGTSLSGGGAEYVTGVMIRAITTSIGILFENNAKDELQDRRLYKITNFIPRRWYEKLFINFYRLLYIQITKLIWRPAITISHLEGPNFLNLLTFGGGRRIIFIHNSPSKNYHNRNLNNKIKILLITLLYRRANIVVGVSDEICNEIYERYGVKKERILCLNNPINIGHIRERSRQIFSDWRRLIVREKYILNVASFTDQKNHKLLLDIYRYLLDIGIDVKLLLLGDGPKKSEMVEYCRSLDISSVDLTTGTYDPTANVFFLGHQENPYPFYLSSKLFLLTSLWEGFPVSLLEVFTLGVPTIVSDCSSGVRKILDISSSQTDVDRSTGFKITSYGHLMYEFRNIDTGGATRIWAQSIIDILNDSEYYNSCSTAAKIKAESYDVSATMPIWEREFGITCILPPS